MDSLPISEVEVSQVIVAVAVIGVTTLLLACCCLTCSRRNGEYTVQVWVESDSTAQQQNWHKGTKLNEAVSSFHLRYARVPVRLDEARKGHTELIERLLRHLRGRGIQVHPEYVGSAYEGVKVSTSEGHDDLEFDVLITMKLPRGWKVQAERISNRPGHVFLSQSDSDYSGQKNTFFDDVLTSERSRYSWGGTEYYLDGKKTIDKFFGEVQNWINLSWETKQKILLRRHGPAVQVDVYEQKVNSNRPYYTVDLVPALEIEVSPGKTLLYVAKPVKSRIMPDPVSWRLLSSEETKFRGSYSDERVDKFTPTHSKYMLEIEKHLRYRLRFAGHKIGTSDNNLEFKMLVIDDSKANRIEASPIEYHPNFVRLNQRIEQTKERLNSRKETTVLVSALQQAITSSSLLNGRVHIRRDGTTVRLIVCEIDDQIYAVESSSMKTSLYSVDMILSYEIGGRLYAARPHEEWYRNEIENSKAWRISFSIEAKDAMYGQYGCLKMVFRVLKVLRNREVALAPLTSYHLKTVLLWLIREQGSSAWNERNLAQRLMDALLRLEKCLKEKNLPHYFLPEVNLTSHMVEDCINSMGCRIHVLCTKEKEMMRALQALN